MGFFDGSEIIDSGALPQGDYQAVIVGAEEKENKAGTGSYVRLDYEILEQGGLTVSDFMNLFHDNVKVAGIAKRQFKQLLVATTGEPDLENLEDLIGKKLTLTLGQTEFNGEVVNSVKKHKPFNVSDVPF